MEEHRIVVDTPEGDESYMQSQQNCLEAIHSDCRMGDSIYNELNRMTPTDLNVTQGNSLVIINSYILFVRLILCYSFIVKVFVTIYV